MHGRPQQGHGAAQLYHASGIAALLDHLIDARGAQPWMLIQGLANELHVGIGDTGAQRLGAVEPVRFDGMTNGLGVHVEFSCNSADFPVFSIKVTANLHVGFRADHLFSLPDREIRGKGSTNRPLRPQTTQRRNATGRFSGLGRGAKVALEPDEVAAGVNPDVPHPNSAGEEIEKEP